MGKGLKKYPPLRRDFLSGGLFSARADRMNELRNAIDCVYIKAKEIYGIVTSGVVIP